MHYIHMLLNKFYIKKCKNKKPERYIILFKSQI